MRGDATGCTFVGPYRLNISLTAGSSAQFYEDTPGNPTSTGSAVPVPGCEQGSAGAPVIQTSDTSACTLIACLGDNCHELGCEPDSPVSVCTASDGYERRLACGCTKPTSWRIDATTHMLDPGATCPASCITSMQCEYAWRLYAP
jgi:hypothetical protein